MTVEKIGKRVTVMIMITMMTALTSLTACAAGGGQGGGQQGGPPPEAYTACEGKTEGATISIKSPQGDTVSATCTMLDGKLAAVPEGHGKR
ncbi:MAG: hypothetical protein ACI8ZB_003029 [Desulforhopalus sp.]|jgi:hypothetical protein